MSSSGVEIDPEIPVIYGKMRRKKHKFATFKFQGKKLIVPDMLADPVVTETRDQDMVEFNKLKDMVTESNDPRYILYDFSFETCKERTVLKTLAFIFW